MVCFTVKKVKEIKLKFTLSAGLVILASILGISVFAIGLFNLFGQNGENNGDFSSNIFVNGVCLNGKNVNEAKEDILNKLKCDRKNKCISICCEDKKYNVDLEKLEFCNNVDEVLSCAKSIKNDDNNFGIFGNNVYLKIYEKINDDSLQKVISDISLQFDEKMQECSVKCFNPNSSEMFTYQEGKNGREIDKNELKDKLINAINNNDYNDIFIQKNEVLQKVTIDKSKNLTSLIGSFSTKLTNNYNRNKNISLALSAINGIIINPSEIFSFNEIVGARSSNKGYLPAAALSNGELITSYGGGVCQASTTVYGAAIRSNMEILERWCHSLKSSYVPVGLDSTVSYDSADLKFKNILEYPIYIKTYCLGNTIGCEIYGFQPDWYDNVKVVSGYISGSSNRAYAKRIFFKEGKIVKEESLPSSTYKR